MDGEQQGRDQHQADADRQRVARAMLRWPEQARQARQRFTADHRGAQQQRAGEGDGHIGQRADPTAEAKTFQRHVFDGPAHQYPAGNQRWRSPPTRRPRAIASLRRAASAAAAKISSAKPTPPAACQRQNGMVGHRRTPGEFLVAAVVEQPPMTADGAFQRPLPGRVIGLDHIGVEVLPLGQCQHVLDHPRLIGRRRQRPFAHAPGARPADLADQDVLAGKSRHHLGGGSPGTCAAAWSAATG